MATKKSTQRIEAFDLAPGRILAKKYEVLSLLGAGWEGEVYHIRELATGIERTAKLYFPHRNLKDKSAQLYAKKMHDLRHCPIVIQYSTQEVLLVKGIPVTVLISEYIEGELLSQFIARQKGKRVSAFMALHLLHALSKGMACVHDLGDFHGDLHSDNIIMQRYGMSFDLKLVDLFSATGSKRENIQADTVDLIHIFHEALGGAKHYAAQPKEIKDICCGLKRSLILKKFKTAGQLTRYLETMQWSK